MTHICLSDLTIIGSDNGLSLGRRQAIILTNAGILLIGPRGTNFNAILIKIHPFSFKKIYFKMLSGKWRPFCLSLNVLKNKPDTLTSVIVNWFCMKVFPVIQTCSKFCSWNKIQTQQYTVTKQYTLTSVKENLWLLYNLRVITGQETDILHVLVAN